MKGGVLLGALLLHVLAITGLPVLGAGGYDAPYSILDRAVPNAATAFQNAAGEAEGAGAGGRSSQQTAVENAASSFSNDVSTVSSSINSIGETTDPTQIVRLAEQGYAAESDENQQRAVLFGAAGASEATANEKIVDNTPIVLDGLQSIAQNPSTANVAEQLNTLETARNANILPSITQLMDGAFESAGIDQQAPTFPSTTGVENLRSTLTGGGATEAADATDGTGATDATGATGATGATDATGATGVTGAAGAKGVFGGASVFGAKGGFGAKGAAGLF